MTNNNIEVTRDNATLAIGKVVTKLLYDKVKAYKDFVGEEEVVATHIYCLSALLDMLTEVTRDRLHRWSDDVMNAYRSHYDKNIEWGSKMKRFYSLYTPDLELTETEYQGVYSVMDIAYAEKELRTTLCDIETVVELAHFSYEEDIQQVCELIVLVIMRHFDSNNTYYCDGGMTSIRRHIIGK